MKSMNRAKRRFVLALVRGTLCRMCGLLPVLDWGHYCGKCECRLIDDKRKAQP